MIKVSVPWCLVDVDAEVERLSATEFVVIWCDPAQVSALGLSEQKHRALVTRCELECLRLMALDALRVEDGIASILADTATATNSDRDSRIAEVA
jgi:hypothetical protein